jgi:hypothetical protein
MEPELWAELFQGLQQALATVGLAGDADVRQLAERWLRAYAGGVGRYDETLCTLRWNGPPGYTGFDLSQLVVLAGVVLGRPPALALWEDFRRRAEADLLAALAGQGGPGAPLLGAYVARELASVVEDAKAGPAGVHCLEYAYQNLFRALGHEPPGPLPAGWQFGLAAPPCLLAGRPFLPTPDELEAFLQTESKRRRVLRCILQGLGAVLVGLVLGPHRLTALELVYLRYRNSPAAAPPRTPSAADLAALMNQAGCTAVRGVEVTAQNIEQILSRDIRAPAQRQVDEAQAAGTLPPRAGGRWEALVRPDGYVWGHLFRFRCTNRQGGDS